MHSPRAILLSKFDALEAVNRRNHSASAGNALPVLSAGKGRIARGHGTQPRSA